MRVIRLGLPAALVLCMTGQAAGQDGAIPENLSMETYSLEDRFRINLAGRPTVTATTWTSLPDVTYPARIYSVENGLNRDSLTVVDMTEAEKRHAEQRKNCTGGVRCTEGWDYDVRGAMDYAAWRLTQKYTKLTYIGWDVQDRVEGRTLRFTNANGTQTTAAIHMHENRLYIVESSQPESEPARGFVSQSLQFIDGQGNLIRYRSVYANGWPAPPRVEQEGNADFRQRNINAR